MLAQGSISDVWAAGAAYESYVGRWSRPVAREFIDWLAVPANKRWLDIGCGTGALTWEIVARAAPAAVVGLDTSEGFITYARANTDNTRATFQLGDAQSLPFADSEFDVAVSGLVLNFVPRPEQALAEARRVLRPGGTVAIYVWDYAGEMQLMRHFWNAAVALDPGAEALDEARRFPICKPAPLIELLKSCGFAKTEYRIIDVPTTYRDFADYWSPFLGGQGPAPTYTCALPEAQREKLRERLEGTLPVETDGSIRLMARAFAVRGVR
jgi:SAM-dependent methyltransferase